MTTYLGNDWRAVAIAKWVQAMPSLGQSVMGRVWSIHDYGYAPPEILTTYKMCGEDAVVNGLYDTWLVTGTPDDDASEYTGSLAKPLRDVIVIGKWVT